MNFKILIVSIFIILGLSGCGGGDSVFENKADEKKDIADSSKAPDFGDIADISQP